MIQQTVYLALGSNLHAPACQVKAAIQCLNQLPETALTAQSSLYRTPAIGLSSLYCTPDRAAPTHVRPFEEPAQPDYCNAVVELRTTLPLLKLWRLTQTIEASMGRVRNARLDARVIDIDILLYGSGRFVFPELTVPHIGLMKRFFVLRPLAEIAPTLLLPNGIAVAVWAAQFTEDPIELWVM